MCKCKKQQMLELYQKTINQIDDYVEYGTVDRKMIKMFLDDLTKELGKLNESK